MSNGFSVHREPLKTATRLITPFAIETSLHFLTVFDSSFFIVNLKSIL